MAENHTFCSSLKRLSVFLNGFIAMSGVILIGLGIYVKFKGAVLTEVLGLSPRNLLHVAHLCLVMGCSTVLLGLAGWYGTIKESRCILLLAEEETLEHNSVTLKKNYRGYNEPDNYSTDWNLIMEKLKCCGVKNYTDFSGSSFEMRTGYTYPRSCCKSIRAAACNGHDVSTDVIYQEGCFPTLLKITKTQSFSLSWGSLGAAVVQLPGILATLLLFVELG
ncbi:tetraspanin-16 isoform X2 [Desmodus rotundus]|uniref:tetraspanin-16 isoform X2 n=1 Tax=Desmodus rotundus TaxID=9430 RepID=UPI000D18576A|nr:tetraspanin-16 isoform X2 [Desmodus rotundus]